MPLLDELLRLVEEVDRDALTSYPKVKQKCETIDAQLQSQEKKIRAQDEIIQSLKAEVDQLRAKVTKLDEYVTKWERWKNDNWDAEAGMTKNAVAALAAKENEILALQDEIEDLRQMQGSAHDSQPEDGMKARKCECGYLNLEHESEIDPGYFEFPVRCGRCGEPTRNAATVGVNNGPEFRITPKLLSKLASEISIQVGRIRLDPIKLDPLAMELHPAKLDLTVRREPWALYRIQRRALLIGITVLMLSGLFPPWVSFGAEGTKNFIGYSSWFEPPAPHEVCCYAVDVGQLALELVLTCVTILAVVIVLRWHGQSED